MLACYAAVVEFKSSLITQLNIPVRYNLLYLLIVAFNFSILNPIIEEYFWRLFMVKAFIILHNKLDKDGQISRRSKLLIRLVINCFYTGYHFFVIEYIFGWKLASLGVLAIFSVGLALDFVKNNCGFLTAVIMHMGVDFAVVIVFTDLLTKAFIQ